MSFSLSFKSYAVFNAVPTFLISVVRHSEPTYLHVGNSQVATVASWKFTAPIVRTRLDNPLFFSAKDTIEQDLKRLLAAAHHHLKTAL